MNDKNKTVGVEKTIRFSVKDEECNVESTGRPEQLDRSHNRHRSFSLYDNSITRQPLLSLVNSDEADLDTENTENTSAEESLPVPSVTLPKLYRASRRLKRLNTLLFEAVKDLHVQEIGRLIKAGANPNATCSVDKVTACHLAAMRSDDALTVLLSSGADKLKSDRLGRTPLHIAAWAGNIKQIAMILGFSEDLQKRLVAGDRSTETEEEIEGLRESVKELVNIKCDFSKSNTKLSKDRKSNMIDHDFKEFEKSLPLFQPGWSPLHAACASAHYHCAWVLLAAGADACARDFVGRTPLDVTGSAYYTDHNIDPQNFADTVEMLMSADCKNIRINNRKMFDTSLHTAVEIESLEAVSVLVAAQVPVNWLNRAGQTPLHICVKKQLKEHLRILALRGVNDANIPTSVDVKNKDGHTVLHEAVLEDWAPGVCVAIEAGANIIAKDNKGETPIHLAASKGNVVILNEILNVAKGKDLIDTLNNEMQTALFKAVINGHVECVKILLQQGASITKTLPRQVNVFHIAAENGYLDVLTVLLDHDYTITRRMINYLTADDKKGYGPIHFAVQNNHPQCVKILLSRNAYRSLRTSYGLQKGSTPLHIAAIYNNIEIAKIIIYRNTETVHIINDMGWTPLHTASNHGSRDMIEMLLKEGADLSCYTNGPNKCRTTAIDMIMNNLSKPTEFMENIFNKYISTNNSSLQDHNCEITINYKILVPKEEEKEQMAVINALLHTGDRYGQRRLLVHPLLESFLCLKWKHLLPFFYTMIAFYAFFVLSLTTYIILAFNDKQDDAPAFLNTTAWTVVLYITVILIISQELVYMNVSNGYFLQLETWVKFSSICMAVILPFTVNLYNEDWPRHVATVALLLSWLEMMFLLSRFPNWGYYVLMFGKVSANVIKILLTFVFLVIGFALSFMIQFHGQKPFENPWVAFVKTMVMMTSEFDYEDLVKEDTDAEKKFATSLLVVRLIFLVFLILAAIVLMNLMVGVAVNDLHNLQVLGNVRRLAKQVEFLGSLENLVQNRIFKKILPKWLENMLSNKKKVLKDYVLSPNLPKSKCYRALPSHIREAIFEKAQSQKKQMDDELGSQNYKKKLDEIYEATVKTRFDNFTVNTLTTRRRRNTSSNEVAKHLSALDTEISNVKTRTKTSIKEIKSSIADLNNKMDLIFSKLDSR